MARRARTKGAGTSRIVAVLVCLVCAMCIFTSWSEKSGRQVALPTLDLTTPDFLQDFLDDFGRDDTDDEPVADINVVSSSLPGAKLEVHFLDVGQAESILIKAPKASVLIDAGERGQGDSVVRYLKKQGVRELDYVIGTHPHSDHIGGMDTVIRDLRVKAVILPDLHDDIVPTTRVYTDLLEAIADTGLTITAAKPGRSYSLGDGAELTILGPLGQYADLNNVSVVSRLEYGETSFLFTGDAETGAESDLLTGGGALRSTVLNVGHHGSSTSTGDTFLQRVSPRIAVISCGIDNSYGHPHREIIEKLESHGARIHRTDLEGTVVVASDGERLAVTTEK